MFSIKEIYLAYRQCRLRKKASNDQIKFEIKLMENLTKLKDEINNGKYAISPYRCFVVLEPKPREIFAANFKDRIVHHLIVSKIQPVWEKKFYYGSFACRRGKGVHSAIKYLQNKHRSLSMCGKKEIFFLQMDLASFFVTINREVLFDLMAPYIEDPHFKRLVEQVFLHNPLKDVIIKSSRYERSMIPYYKSLFNQSKNQGIPIGNLTSQFGANVYLNSLDHFIMRSLRPGCYLRYMDDLLLLDSNAVKLESCIGPIEKWINVNRFQKINPRKTTLGSFRKNKLNYLGYKIIEDKGILSIHAQSEKKYKLISNIKKLNTINENEIDNVLVSIRARLGYFTHSKSFNFRRVLVNKLNEDLELRTNFLGRKKIKVKTGYRKLKSGT